MHHAVCITQATKNQEGMVYNSLRHFYVNCVGTKYQHSIISVSYCVYNINFRNITVILWRAFEHWFTTYMCYA